jgi:SET domain-containing protein
MNRKQLLENLKNETYCMLKPSPIHGVGVFAIRDIPKGVNPFKGYLESKCHIYDDSELKQTLLPEVYDMVSRHFVLQKGKRYIPSCGLNGIDISYYVNFSKTPNLRAVDLQDDTLFFAKRRIKKGEELTVDYTTYDDEDVNYTKYNYGKKVKVSCPI